MNEVERQRVRLYIDLMDEFLVGRIDATEFDKRYEPMFLKDTFDFSEEVFLALDKLFADADAFCADINLRDPLVNDIGPDELKCACADARNKLIALLTD